MKNVLWISLRAPYDQVPHAGGKAHNYLIKKIKENTLWNIRLISFCRTTEIDKVDLDRYQIENEIFIIDDKGMAGKLRKVFSIVGLPPSLYEYKLITKSFKNKICQYKNGGYKPDIIILQWTEIVIHVPFIRKIFPEAKIVCIEEDVTFLKLQRKYEQASGIKKIMALVQLVIIKKRELRAILEADLGIIYTKKDQKLLTDNGIQEVKLFEMVPYFQGFKENVYVYEKNTILYYGAMNRPENEEAVLWFIDNVLPKLLIRNKQFKFVIVGAYPSQKLLKQSCENVIVTGYVDDITEYFGKCLCMVIPLQMGAGVKIKVLEGMSAGIPILTNRIGIEGILAIDKQDFFLCETVDEYLEAIFKLFTDRELAKTLGENARKFILQNYERDECFGRLLERMNKL